MIIINTLFVLSPHSLHISLATYTSYLSLPAMKQSNSLPKKILELREVGFFFFSVYVFILLGLPSGLESFLEGLILFKLL